MDMTEGIIARFRTMAISRASALTGHVAGGMIQTLVSLAVVTGVALLTGFRPTAGPVRWIAAIGVLAMIALALTWLSVALGLVTKSLETASNLPMPLMLLPFLGSGFVPAGPMPAGLRWFAEHQPFTPIIETLRELLMGTPIGTNAAIAAAWCAGITLFGYLWAKTLSTANPHGSRSVSGRPGSPSRPPPGHGPGPAPADETFKPSLQGVRSRLMCWIFAARVGPRRARSDRGLSVLGSS